MFVTGSYCDEKPGDRWTHGLWKTTRHEEDGGLAQQIRRRPGGASGGNRRFRLALLAHCIATPPDSLDVVHTA